MFIYLFALICLSKMASSHFSQAPSLSTSFLEERQHIGSHHSDLNMNVLAEDQLRFLYFQMHDGDRDGRLDGCELVKSLLHWHDDEYEATGPRIFGHDELALIVDPVLESDDKNGDGFVDYGEFVDTQKAKGL